VVTRRGEVIAALNGQSEVVAISLTRAALPPARVTCRSPCGDTAEQRLGDPA